MKIRILLIGGALLFGATGCGGEESDKPIPIVTSPTTISLQTTAVDPAHYERNAKAGCASLKSALDDPNGRKTTLPQGVSSLSEAALDDRYKGFGTIIEEYLQQTNDTKLLNDVAALCSSLNLG